MAVAHSCQEKRCLGLLLDAPHLMSLRGAGSAPDAATCDGLAATAGTPQAHAGKMLRLYLALSRLPVGGVMEYLSPVQHVVNGRQELPSELQAYWLASCSPMSPCLRLKMAHAGVRKLARSAGWHPEASVDPAGASGAPPGILLI